MHPDTIKKMTAMIAFIKAYQMDQQTSPSYAEIGAEIKCNETYVGRLLLAAEKRGLIRRAYGARRDIEVVA